MGYSASNRVSKARYKKKNNAVQNSVRWDFFSECAYFDDSLTSQSHVHKGLEAIGNTTEVGVSVITEKQHHQGMRCELSETALENHHKTYLDHVYAVSDDDGDLIEHYRYSAFGEIEVYSPSGTKLADSAIDNTVTWNSRRYDFETELYYYKYRHYKADIGRWLGRDPIEELHGLVGNEPTIMNLYQFSYNSPYNWIDLYGLVEFGGSAGGKSNCLGGALTGRNDVDIYPTNKKPKDSFKDAIEDTFNLECKEVKSHKDCQCKCEKTKILITLWHNTNPKNKGKNPWTDPKFEWSEDDGSGRDPLTDYHAVRGVNGCSNKYTQIPHARPHPQKRSKPFTPGKIFDKGYHLLCCCSK